MNCYIHPDVLRACHEQLERVALLDIEVNSKTLAKVARVPLAKIKAWTVSGLFHGLVRRERAGSHGRFLYRLGPAAFKANELKSKYIQVENTYANTKRKKARRTNL